MNWFVSLQVPPRPLSCIQDPFHPLLRLVVAYCPFTNPYCIPRCLCVLSYLVPWHFIPLFGFCLLVWLISVDVSVYGICFCCIRFPPPLPTLLFPCDTFDFCSLLNAAFASEYLRLRRHYSTAFYTPTPTQSLKVRFPLWKDDRSKHQTLLSGVMPLRTTWM